MTSANPIAVARGVDPAAVATLSGVAGSPVRAVSYGTLTALVSTVDLIEFGAPGLRRNFEDLGWLEATATFDAALRRVQGRTEWGLKVYLDLDDHPVPPVDHADTDSPGTAYLRRRRARRRDSEELRHSPMRLMTGSPTGPVDMLACEPVEPGKGSFEDQR